MRFKVPQFIEVEDKIFGPLTFKQFVYLVGGGGLSYVIWTLLPSFVAIILIAPVLALAIALAFYKPNNKPFVNMLEAAIKYGVGSKLYLWAHENREVQKEASAAQTQKPVMDVPKLSQSKLNDLSWELDIHESIYSEDTKPE